MNCEIGQVLPGAECGNHGDVNITLSSSEGNITVNVCYDCLDRLEALVQSTSLGPEAQRQIAESGQ